MIHYSNITENNHDEIMKTMKAEFARRLRKVRIKNHHTQSQLSDMIGGRTEQTARNWEKGWEEGTGKNKLPSIEQLFDIAALYKIRPSYLLAEADIDGNIEDISVLLPEEKKSSGDNVTLKKSRDVVEKEKMIRQPVDENMIEGNVSDDSIPEEVESSEDPYKAIPLEKKVVTQLTGLTDEAYQKMITLFNIAKEGVPSERYYEENTYLLMFLNYLIENCDSISHSLRNYCIYNSKMDELKSDPDYEKLRLIFNQNTSALLTVVTSSDAQRTLLIKSVENLKEQKVYSFLSDMNEDSINKLIDKMLYYKDILYRLLFTDETEISHFMLHEEISRIISEFATSAADGYAEYCSYAREKAILCGDIDIRNRNISNAIVSGTGIPLSEDTIKKAKERVMKNFQKKI